MPSPTALVVAIVLGAVWYGGTAVVHGAKKAGHAIVRVLKDGVHPKK